MSNIIVQGKQYYNVPSIDFEKVGGGTATYTESGGGGGTTIEQLNVSAAGTYTAPTGTAYSPVVVPSGTEGTPTAAKGTVSSHSVTVTPSVTNTGGYISGSIKTGTGVTVSASELVSGTKSITSSGTTDVTNYANASVASGTEGTPVATKGTVSGNSISITPSVTNVSGFIIGGAHTGTAVTVSASELVSGTKSITSAGTTDVTNYESASVASGSATTPSTTITASPTISVGSDGLITASVSASQSVTPTVSSGFVSSGTSGTISVSGSNASQLSTQSATTITPTTSSQTAVASGKYTTGAITVDPIPSQYIIPTGTVSITSNGTVDVAQYASASVNVSGGSPYPWLGNGAEKVGTIINQTINLKNDTTYDSWTASTTATTIKSASESPDYTASLNIVDYDYCIVTHGFVQPVYFSGTPMKSTTYRVAQYHVQYYIGCPASSNTSGVQSNTATQALSFSSSNAMYVQLYYNSSGVLTARSATQCGAIYMSSSPTYSGASVTDGNLSFTYKIPAFYAKCDSSRFTTTRKTQVDSANTNYILTVDLYRVPHGNGVFSKWVTEMCNALNT